MRPCRALLVAWIGVAGCAHPPSPPHAHALTLPVTGRDDAHGFPPHAPSASRSRAGTATVSALRAEGALPQARALAVALARAFLGNDETTLYALLDEHVTHTPDDRPLSRDEALARCLPEARVLFGAEGRPADAIFDFAAIGVQPASERRVHLPHGVRATDLFVSLPRQSEARRAGDLLRPCLDGIWVRPGPRPRVVALGP